MSKEGNKDAVFKTTKVRTKLRGDNSWLQRRSESQPETNIEKPWIAEVRASRLNGANVESSPVSSPTQPSPSPLKPSSERSPTSGFMIRGVFTKTEKTPPSSNGYSGTTQFTKKPSETYKKIAPHIVRSTENQEVQLSQEEQEKRTAAASKVLTKSAGRQRSYVLSAAKLYESKDKTPDLLVNSTTSFVAQRVDVADDEESNTSTGSTSPTTTTVTNVTPLPRPRTLSKKEVTKPEEVKVEEKAPEKDPFENMVPGCTKVATPLPELIPDLVQAVYVKSDESADAEQPESPVVETAPTAPAPATPPPEAVTVESIVTVTEEAVKVAPESPVVEPAPTAPAPATPPTTPPPEAVTMESIVIVTEEAVKVAPESPVVEPAPTAPAPATPPAQAITVESIVTVTEEAVKVSPEQEPEPKVEETGRVEISSDSISVCDPDTTPERFIEEKPLQLVEDLVQIFENTQINVKQEEPEQPLEEVEGQKETEPETQTLINDEPKQDLFEIERVEISAEQEPSPPVSSVEPQTDDLLGFNDSGPQLVQLVSQSTGPWGQDLLTPVESEKPDLEKTGNIVDLLSNDDTVITQVLSLSTQPDVEEENPPATEAQSVTETVTITTRTVIITDGSEAESADPLSSHVITTVTESSSTDPFDPYPIGTTSSNSSSDLLQPLADISINSVSSTSVETKETDPETHLSSNALKSLSDDIIPFNTEDTTRLSTHRSWARTWETPQPESTEESQEAAAAEGGQDGDQQTVIMFERKSKENDSPWDRWTSPTVYTVDNEDDEEEEPAKSEETETQVVTTVTTIRETYSEPEPSMDRILTEPEPESKKPFVYVKEYVNTTDLSLRNARDTDRSDYLTSSTYSSTSTYKSSSLSSKCTFCDEPVGNDAKITIEHLNINCHPDCFKCDVCTKPMGDLLHKMFLHGGKVQCETCYRKL